MARDNWRKGKQHWYKLTILHRKIYGKAVSERFVASLQQFVKISTHALFERLRKRTQPAQTSGNATIEPSQARDHVRDVTVIIPF